MVNSHISVVIIDYLLRAGYLLILQQMVSLYISLIYISMF